MNKDQLFNELLHALQDLVSFAPYASDGVSEGMLRSKLRAVGEKLISAAEDGENKE